MAFWRSPHGPLGSGPPRAGYSQRGKMKKGEKREKEERKKEKEKKRKRRKRRRVKADCVLYRPVIPCLGFVGLHIMDIRLQGRIQDLCKGPVADLKPKLASK